METTDYQQLYNEQVEISEAYKEMMLDYKEIIEHKNNLIKILQQTIDENHL